MSVLIICFSCVPAFADTTVDGTSDLFNKEYFIKRVEKTHYLSDSSFNLSALPSADYLTIFSDGYYTDTQYKTVTYIRATDSFFNYCEEDRYYSSLGSDLADNEIRFVYLKNEKCVILLTKLLSYVYSFSDNNFRPLVNVLDYSNKNGTVFWFPVNESSNYPYGYFINNKEACNFINTKSNYQSFMANITSDRPYCEYVPSLFPIFAQIIPGYTGHIVDTSFEGLLSDKGLTCDSSITKNYKYQISYIKNNDLVMMFLNNNKKPDLKIEDYKDGLNTDSKKYTFTYNSVYDTIVYFPQYQKYLNYDDWYSSESVPKDFRWFWSEDKKSFSLISDWNVSFDDTGKASYNGTRVVVNWKLDESSIDNISLTKSWQVDKEMLKDKGWKEGRPSDQNYPYCVQLWQNNIPIYSVYFNSKPKVRINRESDYYCEYAIDMIGMCGYVYSEWADMSTQFDFTTGKVAKGSDILSQGQNLVWYLFNDLGGRVDDSCLLHLYDNYKGDDEHFVGTKVFFNWDVTSNTFDTNLKNQPDFDYSKTLLKGGEYKDENGHIHGGSLKNYDDEDLNKWNTNGKDDNNNKDTPNSSSFDFSFEGITEYCKDFWNFMQSALAIFPSFVWLLVGASIAVLIALRLLGR